MTPDVGLDPEAVRRRLHEGGAHDEAGEVGEAIERDLVDDALHRLEEIVVPEVGEPGAAARGVEDRGHVDPPEGRIDALQQPRHAVEGAGQAVVLELGDGLGHEASRERGMAP